MLCKGKVKKKTTVPSVPFEGEWKMAPVEHVVADAGAFLRGAPLQEIGKNIYTIREVVTEIRDKETRRRLAVLPYQLHFKEPFPEYVQRVTEFSKKTGDYPSLSATDIQILALTYQLEAENVGVAHLKKEPEQKTKCPSGEKRHPATGSRECTELASPEASEFGSFLFWRNPLPSIEEDLLDLLKADAVLIEPEKLKGHESGEEEESGEDSEDDEGWITPSNIKQIQQDPSQGEEPAGVQVACITTDFAMQNVLLQMGLHVLAVNGMLIRRTRSHIMRCHGCFKTTSEMTRLFCPHCGNKTLKKVAVTVGDDGSLHVHFSQNPKVLNPRGLRHSLPAPQGGKHANNPHLTEDQRFPQQRLSRKARQKTNVFDPNYITGVSPFVENDIYSRAANLQIRDAALGAGRRRLNPNTVTKKFVKKR
ncbi:RNA-binding protein NOB1 isoform X2 [Rhineura floridana]|uniref:RNA-binding protein NOB1 isoform X2 n=1 Tax=Rhineura floridana TaxID=261503 RepID=UPI002AC83EA3|nr:RNA-binding protein NOB1 isoform X2 [Rhineura floridana]